MKEASPMLLPLLRSRAQGDIIAWILLHPEEEFSLAEISRAVGVSGPTVMREVDRLAEAGLIREVRRGNQRLVRVDTANPVFEPLADLMAVTFGPLPVLRELLADLTGVREAWIYGSWAARYAQQPGPVPGDIDVLVVGAADLDALDEVAEAAGQRLGREVNIRRVRPSAWDAAAADPFKTTVTSRPMVALIGDESR
jgi:DNA-binding transcriptional ArsR family regulator